MDNKKKYQKIFIESLSIDSSKFNENIEYNSIEEWDSIGHMTLMSGLEDAFEITIETDDIVDFESYKKGIEILKKYKVKI
jgi:acyl carrier protein|tara:strand:+ start:235 stop:474 length:240 start_codon:yes stop_codon:yes gene_type:complete